MRLTRPFSTAPEPSSYARVTPSFAIAWTDSSQRTGAVTCWTSSSLDLRRILGRLGGDVRDDRHARRARSSTPAIAAASRSAAGFISEQWNGALTGSFFASFAPAAFASAIARSIAAAWPRDHDLPGAVEVRRLDRLARRATPRSHSARGLREIEAHQRRHRALPDRHGLLHELAAQVREAHRVAQRRARPRRRARSTRRASGRRRRRTSGRARAARGTPRSTSSGSPAACAWSASSSSSGPSKHSFDSAKPSASSASSYVRRATGVLEREIAAHADSLRALAGEQERRLHGRVFRTARRRLLARRVKRAALRDPPRAAVSA